MSRKVKVAIYGAGDFANKTHLPNLMKIELAEVVAVCDINLASAKSTAETFQIPHVFTDGHRMLTEVVTIKNTIICRPVSMVNSPGMRL